ncbi:hypothetical protein Q5P01_017218 [Channa striata]|uniref:TNF family profile domain-containing protein n=1 Tax=Channa striata TaxID=64152 RepID=A0AA88SB98_CHASR|nr:hypothetical protein Q5P01_017218 [Channa striata]
MTQKICSIYCARVKDPSQSKDSYFPSLTVTSLRNTEEEAFPFVKWTQMPSGGWDHASLSAAIGLTMPQHTQHSLIHVLLLWTTILSITQVVFIIFFFSAEHHGPSQNNSAVAPAPMKGNSTPSPPSNDGAFLGKGRMLTFLFSYDGDKTTWHQKSQDEGPVSQHGNGLKIMKDGYYLLILQMKLDSCSGSENISLKWSNNVLLQGDFTGKKCTTGLLGKAEEMAAGGTLEVSIYPPNYEKVDQSATRLDIIYIHKP